ncbi:MAG: ChaN family lipoprotein, partial [Burkholderiaceae bacterium]|nr:ChaN family lipoprotein [Burkholderiaceae bacterium]
MRLPPFPPIWLLLKKHLSLALCGLGCLLFFPTAWGLDPLAVTGSIVRMSDMAPVSMVQLLQAVRVSDVAVLGEVHDNPRHHQLRGELLRQLPAASKTVVAEHLNWRLRFKEGGELLTNLQAAGFDEKGWGWPLHQPLFEAVTAMQMPLMGGNLPGESIKEVFKTRGQGLPEAVRTLLAKTPFDEQQRKAMNEEIDQGH